MTHAPDKMGQAAQKAAQLATKLDVKLLGAASPTLSREERAANLVRFFRQYRAFTRAVVALETVAPGCAEQGYDEDAQAQEFIEGKAA